MTRNQALNQLAKLEKSLQNLIREKVSPDADVRLSSDNVSIFCHESEAEAVKALLAGVKNLRFDEESIDEDQVGLFYDLIAA